MAWLGLAACGRLFGLEPPAANGFDAAANDDANASLVDAGVADAGVCAASSEECVSFVVLRTCSGPGAMAVDTACTWSCASAPTAHCTRLVPSGGAVVPDDLDGTGLANATISATTTINTDTGAISPAIPGVNYTAIGNVAVFRFNSLTINAAVNPIGSRAIALVSATTATVNGIIDLRTRCSSEQTPGGFRGGDSGRTALGPGGGGSSTSQMVGGGGGGHGTAGGTGGASGAPIAGGPVHGDPAISQLVGGGGGGGGGDDRDGRIGGTGGGAIQIASTSITITAAGGINAGGCRGIGNNDGGGGSGGGAGGAILLEAREVVVEGKLAANGGSGGGGGGAANDGVPGLLDRVPAAGGAGQYSGGHGAAGPASASPGGSPNGGNGGGGGGGGLGRIRINTLAGMATIGSGAIMSPALADGTSATQGPVALQ